MTRSRAIRLSPCLQGEQRGEPETLDGAPKLRWWSLQILRSKNKTNGTTQNRSRRMELALQVTSTDDARVSSPSPLVGLEHAQGQDGQVHRLACREGREDVTLQPLYSRASGPKGGAVSGLQYFLAELYSPATARGTVLWREQNKPPRFRFWNFKTGLVWGPVQRELCLFSSALF